MSVYTIDREMFMYIITFVLNNIQYHCKKCAQSPKILLSVCALLMECDHLRAHALLMKRGHLRAHDWLMEKGHLRARS